MDKLSIYLKKTVFLLLWSVFLCTIKLITLTNTVSSSHNCKIGFSKLHCKYDFLNKKNSPSWEIGLSCNSTFFINIYAYILFQTQVESSTCTLTVIHIHTTISYLLQMLQSSQVKLLIVIYTQSWWTLPKNTDAELLLSSTVEKKRGDMSKLSISCSLRTINDLTTGWTEIEIAALWHHYWLLK